MDLMACRRELVDRIDLPRQGVEFTRVTMVQTDTTFPALVAAPPEDLTIETTGYARATFPVTIIGLELTDSDTEDDFMVLAADIFEAYAAYTPDTTSNVLSSVLAATLRNFRTMVVEGSTTMRMTAQIDLDCMIVR